MALTANTFKRAAHKGWHVVIVLLLSVLCTTLASAQTSSYSNTTSGSINNSTSCSSPLTRTFSIGSALVVDDVNIGIRVTHSWRGDLRFTLISPSGTRVQIVNSPGGSNNSVDDFNVLLDDEAAGGSVSSYTSSAGSSAPPYTVNLTPQSSLSAFDGENAAGVWTLEICDVYPQADNGSFIRADLYITQAGPRADLSLSKTVNTSSPSRGATVSYTISVTNSSSSTLSASGVTVRDVLPGGISFVSANSANGTYSASNGIWTLANSLAPGASATLTINATVTASQGAAVENWAEVWSSSANDSDSTPGNNSQNEDDDASATFTVSGSRTAGTPPSLSCPVGSNVFNWDSRSWSAGSLSNSYTQNNIGQISWDIAINNGSFQSIAQLGGQNPALQNNGNTGGITPAEYSLSLFTDFTTRSSNNATAVIGLPTPVPGLQFRIFDVDYSAGAYADMITVTGTTNGTTVYPTLTNGVSNWVSGNIAVGDGQSPNDSADGTIWVTFNVPVDTVTIEYGNHSTAPNNPATQAIAIHDVTLCNPQAGIKISKSSTNYNDGTNPLFHLPATDVIYTLSVTNDKSATLTTDTVLVIDPLPSQLTFFNGDADGTGPGSNAVIFTNAQSGLTFNYASDVRFSNIAATPTAFSQCTYNPTTGYDPNVRHICVNPKGAMLGQTSTNTPGFTLQFRARIK